MCAELKYPFMRLTPKERKIVFEFVGHFSRMEYSMKCAGYYIRNGSKKGDVDWVSFAKKNQLAFEKCDLDTLCPTLYRNPPMKQVVNENGDLDWKDVPPQGSDSSLLTLSLSLRRARNNLFHGGKYHGGSVHGFRRSNVLLREGVALVKHLATLDDRVKNCWN